MTPDRIRVILSNRTRRYLSWIEDLTTNQGVIGSNPIRRTTNAQTRREFLVWSFFVTGKAYSLSAAGLYVTPVADPSAWYE